MTVSSEVEDGLAILDYVKSLDFVDQSRIAIHGLSMGDVWPPWWRACGMWTCAP